MVTGTALTFRLERLGLSPEQFAAEAGLNRNTIRNHEAGRVARPRRDTTRRMAEALERLERQMEQTKDNPQWP